MMEKKYEITNESKVFRVYDRYVQVFRIRALKDFGDVKKGDLGGWIESEDNLSHEGNCWIYDDAIVCIMAEVRDNAKVCGTAKVYDKAQVYDKARVCGNSSVFRGAKVYENSHVLGHATIKDFSIVHGESVISDHAVIANYSNIFGCATVFGYAFISNYAYICGTAEIYGYVRIERDAIINKCSDFFVAGPIGSRDDYTTFFKNKDGVIIASTGCFTGTIDEFIEAINETHKNDEMYRNSYLNLIKFIKDSWRDKNDGEEVRDN